jgi:hypothetical protein
MTEDLEIIQLINSYKGGDEPGELYINIHLYSPTNCSSHLLLLI